MALADYACRYYRERSLLRESEGSVKWTYRLAVSKPLPSVALEEEIYILRRKMEQVASQEHSLSAPNVVEISAKLDRVLNDYMFAKLRA